MNVGSLGLKVRCVWDFGFRAIVKWLPQSIGPSFEKPGHEVQTVDPKPETLNPKPQTLNPKPSV